MKDASWVLTMIAIVVAPAFTVGLIVALGYALSAVLEFAEFVARRLRGL